SMRGRNRRARLRGGRGLGRRPRTDALRLPVREGLPVVRAEPEVRQPERDARQGRRTAAPAPDARLVIEIRPLAGQEVGIVDAKVPLSRLDQPGGEYLVAWADGEPVGHAHIDWREDPPELQDVLVAESHRRRGIGSALTTAAEELVRERGHSR